MEPAQPADRVPADPTPPEGQPPTSPSRATDAATGATPPSGSAAGPEPALVEPPAGTGGGEPALVAPTPTGADRPHPAVRPAGKQKSRSERSPKDMALSLLVLLVPIALLLAFYRGFLGGEQPVVVDPGPAYESARSANAFPVSEPTGLGSGWRTVSATYRAVDGGVNLRVGYLTPEGRGVQLVQSNVPPEKLLPQELTAQGQPQGPTDLGGRSWQRYTGRGNDQALVLLEPGRTVIVVGDAREGELRQLADSLR
ncbi:DUF4245 domain-containing protein [Micromonospora sp. KC723]|uniref:DUF4245 domain-containing protein n=1 Tax=Micromonospora sp. KC723 TaxID=2530381 RepID=UPI0014051D56|nr:DUF4245 domain-containing protein [Micromonospora sp. KC723]